LPIKCTSGSNLYDYGNKSYLTVSIRVRLSKYIKIVNGITVCCILCNTIQGETKGAGIIHVEAAWGKG
jgi:hypothetical protein